MRYFNLKPKASLQKRKRRHYCANKVEIYKANMNENNKNDISNIVEEKKKNNYWKNGYAYNRDNINNIKEDNSSINYEKKYI